MHQERLLNYEFEPGDMRVLRLVDISKYFNRGPVVFKFPIEVRQKNKEANQRTHPNPGLAQLAPFARHQERKKEGESENKHRVLVQYSDPGHEPEQQPEPRVPGPNDAQRN